jgi:NADH:ubiquinone oxidoreductase subunit D
METKIIEYRPGFAQSNADDPIHGETLPINMGPQHPATHGVLRLAVELAGATMAPIAPPVGVLDRG